MVCRVKLSAGLSSLIQGYILPSQLVGPVRGLCWLILWLCGLWDISLGSLCLSPLRGFLCSVDILGGRAGTYFGKKMRFTLAFECMFLSLCCIWQCEHSLSAYSWALSLKLFRASGELAAKSSSSMTNALLFEYVPVKRDKLKSKWCQHGSGKSRKRSREIIEEMRSAHQRSHISEECRTAYCSHILRPPSVMDRYGHLPDTGHSNQPETTMCKLLRQL